MTHLPEREVFAKTLYAEANGEPEEGKWWVCWVIKNRAHMNRPSWGGPTIRGVCLQPEQFECWDNKNDIPISQPEVYKECRRISDSVYDAHISADPTGGADHYNNPDKDGFRGWTRNCDKLRKIGDHQFYRE